MRKNTMIFGLFACILALMLASQVDALKKGPRASLLSSTACALDLDTAELVITITLTNKSSGEITPETRDGGEIKATYKRTDELGNIIREFPEVFPILTGVPIPTMELFEARFTLCDNGNPRQEVIDARELNGKATIFYGILGGEGETRMITNRCSNDPDTMDVDEGAIKVDDATFADIAAACSP